MSQSANNSNDDHPVSNRGFYDFTPEIRNMIYKALIKCDRGKILVKVHKRVITIKHRDNEEDTCSSGKVDKALKVVALSKTVAREFWAVALPEAICVFRELESIEWFMQRMPHQDWDQIRDIELKIDLSAGDLVEKDVRAAVEQIKRCPKLELFSVVVQYCKCQCDLCWLDDGGDLMTLKEAVSNAMLVLDIARQEHKAGWVASGDLMLFFWMPHWPRRIRPCHHEPDDRCGQVADFQKAVNNWLIPRKNRARPVLRKFMFVP